MSRIPWRTQALVAGTCLALLSSCGADPGADLDPTVDETYLAWTDETAPEFNEWHSAFIAAADEYSSEGSSSLDALERMRDAAERMDSGLEAAGSPPSPPAPRRFVDAIRWTIDHVVDDLTEALDCHGSGCTTIRSRVGLAPTSLDLLIQMSLEENRHPVVHTRTKTLEEAAIDESDLGGEPQAVFDPLAFLCRPDFEPDEQDVPPEESVDHSFNQSESQSLDYSLRRWPTSAAAVLAYETIRIRSLTCPLAESVSVGGVTRSIYATAAPDLGVPAFAWRTQVIGGPVSFYTLVVGGLVDDTMVLLALSSTESDPAARVGDILLNQQLVHLGAKTTWSSLEPPS